MNRRFSRVSQGPAAIGRLADASGYDSAIGTRRVSEGGLLARLAVHGGWGTVGGANRGTQRSKPRLAFESLESRVLLSVAPFGVPSAAGCTNDPSPLAAFPTITWTDGETHAYTGDWIASFEPVTGSPNDERRSFEALVADVFDGSGVSVSRQLGRDGVVLLDAPAGMTYDQLNRSLSALPGFQYVEPDFVVTVRSVPNDPQFGNLWGLNNTGQTGGTPDADIDAPEAWDVTTGDSDIIVGVIDTGVDYNHPDLAANMWTNPGEVPGNGIDDDGNGFIDDVYGWDFANDDNDPFDDHSHGTHVSGTIGAEGNNSLGVVGVNWNVQIMALKFISAAGTGSMSDAIDAINYATNMRVNFGIDIRVTNNSWGGGGFSQALEDAIAASGDAGILFVAAAGNDASDIDALPSYPASFPLDNVISVAATTDTDGLAVFSNYGATSVDLGAPGQNILSTVPGGGYGSKSGTSMASPHVAGAVALAWSRVPTASAAEIRDAIFAGVDPVTALSGVTVTGGRLNLAGTLAALGMRVVGSTPAEGEIVASPPVDFVIDFSEAYDLATIDPGDLTVNGIPADTVSTTGGAADADTVVFHFNFSPVTLEGLQAMAIADNAILSAATADPLQAWTGSFRYDAVRMEVVSTNPPDGSLVPLPMTSLEVDFNEPFDPASLGTGNLLLSQGLVVMVEAVDGDTARYTLSGITDEETLTLSLAAGNVTDTFGNPALPFLGTYLLDTTVAAANEFERARPLGGLVFESRENTRLVSFAGDEDEFSLFATAGESVSALVVPEDAAATLSIELVGLGVSYTSPAPGEAAVLPATTIPLGGTVNVRVSGDMTTPYSLQIFRDSAVEGVDSAPGSEVALDASYLQLGSGRYAGVGTSSPTPLETEVVFEAHFESGLEGFVLDNSFGTGGGLWHGSTGRSADGLPNHSPPGSLYYGKGEGSTGGGTYFNSVGNGGAVLSPVITLPTGEASLSFHHFLETEDFPGYDVAEVAIDAGSGFITLLSSASGSLPTGTGGAWDTVTVDLTAFAGDDIQLRFSFDTIDAFNNIYEGWYVDDVVVTALPDAPDVDLYTVDLTGKAGRSIDVILAGQENADFSGNTLELVGTDGTTVLAVGTPGTGTTNYDLGILDFQVPSDGTYTVRLTSTVAGDYTLIVTDGLTFDTEPNDRLSDPLRSLDDTGGAVGHLGRSVSVLFAAELTSAGSAIIHTVDPQTGGLLNSFPAPPAPETQEFGLNLALDGTSLWFNAGTLTGDNTIYRLDPQTGAVLDVFVASETDSPLGLAYAGGEIFVADFDFFSFDVADIDVYDATTFSYKRSLSVPSGLGLTGLAGDDANHRLWAVDNFTNSVYQLSPTTGTILDSFPSTLVAEQGMAVVGDELFVSDSGTFGSPHRVVVYDPTTMSVVRQFDVPFAGSIGGLGGDGAAATFTTSVSSGGTTVGPAGRVPRTAGQAISSTPEPGGDLYEITLAAGQEVTLRTETPFDSAGSAPMNELDPRIVVFDPVGNMVASDNGSAPDGKNALVDFTAAAGGVYRVQVLAEAGSGEYVLSADSATPPAVEQVLVRGRDWSDAMLTYLADGGLGAGGYAIPTGSSLQLAPLPWTNIDQVIIRFSEDVVVGQNDLEIRGVNVASYGFSNFSYDPGTFTATWTFSSVVATDKLLFRLDGSSATGVVDADDGLLLDGEFVNGVDPLPASGDGSAGGDFAFRVNVLPGDTNQDAVVNLADVLPVYSVVPSSIGDPGYSTLFDVNGSGAINLGDVLPIFFAVPDSLPESEPSGASTNGVFGALEAPRVVGTGEESDENATAPALVDPAGSTGQVGRRLAVELAFAEVKTNAADLGISDPGEEAGPNQHALVFGRIETLELSTQSTYRRDAQRSTGSRVEPKCLPVSDDAAAVPDRPTASNWFDELAADVAVEFSRHDTRERPRSDSRSSPLNGRQVFPPTSQSPRVRGYLR